jgi:hypothetical protein
LERRTREGRGASALLSQEGGGVAKRGREAYPAIAFEVIVAAMPAINSHVVYDIAQDDPPNGVVGR